MKKFPIWGQRVIFSPKNYIEDLYNLWCFGKNLQYNLNVGGGGGSRLIWKFSKSSSDLVCPAHCPLCPGKAVWKAAQNPFEEVKGTCDTCFTWKVLQTCEEGGGFACFGCSTWHSVQTTGMCAILQTNCF